ncbi:MAG: SIS domain-containing protein [Bdellovibrionota bacterium]
MISDIKAALSESQRALNALMSNDKALTAIESAAMLLVNCFSQGGKVLTCGNGGSLCDAMHFAEELSGKFRNDRAPLPAISISDPAHMSCVSNDYGYEFVFSRYVQAHCNSNDILFVISTSGSSKNILQAVKAAKTLGVKVIALTGVDLTKQSCELTEYSDCFIGTPGGNGYADRAQELHIKCIHILIELIEKKLFS